jgi:hypothetical protein
MKTSKSYAGPALVVAALVIACSPDGDARAWAPAPLQRAGLSVGRGYDLLADEVASDCVTLTPGPIVRGDTTTSSLHVVESTEELASFLDATVGGGSTSAEVLNAFHLDADAVQVALVARVSHATAPAASVSLTPDAAALLAADPARFRKRCGDGYVEGLSLGGVFVALLAISTASRVESEAVAAGLRAHGAEAALEAAVGRAVPLYTYEVGAGDGSTNACTNVPCLLDRATNFARVVDGASSAVLGAHIVRYEQLARPGDRAPIDVAAALATRDAIVRASFARTDLASKIDAALAFPAGYASFDAAAARAAVLALDADVVTLGRARAACESNAPSCALPPLAPLPSAPRRE